MPALGHGSRRGLNQEPAEQPPRKCYVSTLRGKLQACDYRARRLSCRGQGLIAAFELLWLKFCCGLGSALSALAAGKKSAYHEALAPTVPLSRHVLRAPTRFYKQRRRLDRLVNCHHDD